jgi:adenylate cyclase
MGNGNQIRKLVAIVSVDMAGYSALTERDETQAALRVGILKEQTKSVATRHGGRVFFTAGDGAMLEFSSATAALDATAALMATMTGFRFGVHLGEVLAGADGDLIGHGVNVAARLQELAETDAAVVSSDVHRAVRGAWRKHLQRNGVVHLDKMDETLETFVFSTPPGPKVRATAAARTSTRPRRSLNRPG